MDKQNSRNTILFVVITAIFLFAYQALVLEPQAAKRREAQRQAAAAEKTVTPADAPATRQGAALFANRAQALATAQRVPIETPTLKGSLSLTGSRIDDLFLSDYRERLDEDSPPVELFRPQGMRHAFFALFGWSGQNVAGGVPGPNTVWRLQSGSTLTPSTPVTLAWDNGAGLRFTRTISVDDRYVFTVQDRVDNLSPQAITIAPYGLVERSGVPTALGKQMIIHEGAIGAFKKGDGYVTQQLKYGDWDKTERKAWESTGGWLGITDKYWLAAVLPTQTDETSGLVTRQGGRERGTYRARMQSEAVTIPSGRAVTETQRLYAGAKKNEILEAYEDQLGLPRFVYAIDWGMFWFLTRPIFLTVHWFFGILGNFGLAILALTVVVKLIMFPLANKAYESMSKMRKLQPMMEAIKKKHPDDQAKQQQEIMGLYQKEKINPLAGCLPILVQIPVFYALYKVLFVTIEMRHAPFFGWIRDLSAPDPTNIWNLFGLIPWDPATAPLIGGLLNNQAGGGFTLGLSVLAIFYGATMWLQQAMNPPAADPMQRQIFAFMPILFTFIMAPFAAGLLIYWAWNNILSILQQYVIMHRFKAENPIDSFIARFKKA